MRSLPLNGFIVRYRYYRTVSARRLTIDRCDVHVNASDYLLLLNHSFIVSAFCSLSTSESVTATRSAKVRRSKRDKVVMRALITNS